MSSEARAVGGSSSLSAEEVRVLGCLLEKQKTTPDTYPLSLNSLRLACNQSTNRDPVVQYDEATIREALHRLERRGYVRLASGAGSRAAKYRHLLADALPLRRPEEAVLCTLMLRGPQTPGELKQRSERMYPFADLASVLQALEALIDRELARRLERRPGHKEERYVQLLDDGAEESREPTADAPRVQDAAMPAAHGEPAPPPAAPAPGQRTCTSCSPESSSWSGRLPSCAPACAILFDGVDVDVTHLGGAILASADSSTGVGIPIALAAGLVSFLSPCVLPLVPGYLSTVIGVTPVDLKEGVGVRRVLVPSLLFIASFSAIFILLGLSATVLGSALKEHKEALTKIGGLADHRDGPVVPGEPVREGAGARVALRGADAEGAARRTSDRRRGLCDRVDALHQHHPRRDPHPGRDLELRGPRGAAAGLLLPRPGDPVPGRSRWRSSA